MSQTATCTQTITVALEPLLLTCPADETVDTCIDDTCLAIPMDLLLVEGGTGEIDIDVTEATVGNVLTRTFTATDDKEVSANQMVLVMTQSY